LLVGALGLALGWLGRRRAGQALVTASLLALLAILVLPVDQWLLRPLEDRFARPSPVPNHVDGIIVLGGAMDGALSDDRDLPSLNYAAERITDGVALARRFPAAILVFTGGNGDLEPVSATEADYARRLFDALGLEGRPIVYERRSRNTWENAVFSREIVHPTPGQTWLLVTSASHMPRSVGIFRKVGWPVVPWPVAYKSGHSWETLYTRHFGEKMEQIDWATHEWVGLLSYWLLGRTSALFPAPE
jgi:uncharacterized SAM-binding protein YcdF (DUF218 family)